MRIKKRFLFLIFGMMFIFSVCNVQASLGVMPARVETDFSPNLKFFVNFQVSGAAQDQELDVYATGDLAEYVTFDKTHFIGRDSFTAYVDLPESVEKPGKNKLYIRIAESVKPGAGIGTRLEVGALVIIKVPYPGQYAEIKSFNVNDANSGEPVNFVAVVDSLGQEAVSPSVKIEVEINGEIIDNFFLGTKTIDPQTSETFQKTVKEGYKSGVYNANIFLDYGPITNETREFKIGKLFVDVLNYSSEFNKGRINEFNIEIESQWNSDIDNVYAEVNVTKENEQADFFKTPSVYLSKWEKVNLKGFFNAENLNNGKYDAKIILFYGDQKTEKDVSIRVITPGEANIMILIASVIGVIIIVLVIIIIVYFILKNKKKTKRKR